MAARQLSEAIVGRQRLLALRQLHGSCIEGSGPWRMLSTLGAGQKKQQTEEEEDEDERFPSEPSSSSGGAGTGAGAGPSQEHMRPPGFFFISGGAVASVSVAGVGMAGMFWLGNYLSQVARALRAMPDGGGQSGSASGSSAAPSGTAAARLSSTELAELLKARRAELESELKQLRRARPAAAEAKARAADAASELKLLRAAATGRAQGAWWPY